MTGIARLVRFAVPALALLTAACTNPPATDPSASGTETTAPNANNPYARDPLDPNMNPHYMRGGRH